MNTRRSVVLALGAVTLLASIQGLAQLPTGAKRIGYYAAADLRAQAPWLEAFRQGMAELRWVEGRDYTIDARFANGASETQHELATALIATQPDLLLTPSESSARLLLERSPKTMPIVFTIAEDPVGSGIVANLRRPGGNVTGLTNLNRELGAKRLQLIKEAFPRISHVVVLFEPAKWGSRFQVTAVEDGAPVLGVQVTPIGCKNAAEIEAAFKRGAAVGTHAYMVTQAPLFATQRKMIVDGVFRAKTPVIFDSNPSVEAGGLMSYGASYPDNYRRAAGYVDKILKGAKPGDLPIEQPVKFEMVINLKTAKAMGLSIPQSILLRADRVIE